MRRPLALLTTLVALVAAGCGDGEPGDAVATTTIPIDPPARFTIAEIGNALEGDGLDVVRDAQVGIASEVEPAPTDAVRFADRTGKELSVLVFATPADARRAIPSLADAAALDDGGAIASAYNAVAVLPERPRGGVYAVVQDVFRELRLAGARRVALGRLVREREELLGAAVAARGRIVQRLPNGSPRPRAVTIRGPGGEEVLVAPADGGRLDLPGTEEIVVRGTLARVGGARLDVARDGVLGFRTGDAVILADAVAAP